MWEETLQDSVAAVQWFLGIHLLAEALDFLPCLQFSACPLLWPLLTLNLSALPASGGVIVAMFLGILPFAGVLKSFSEAFHQIQEISRFQDNLGHMCRVQKLLKGRKTHVLVPGESLTSCPSGRMAS